MQANGQMSENERLQRGFGEREKVPESVSEFVCSARLHVAIQLQGRVKHLVGPAHFTMPGPQL